MMERGSWIGVIGVLGSALVMCWTALRELARRTVRSWRRRFGHGLLLVVAASVTLGVAAVARGIELARVTRGA